MNLQSLLQKYRFFNLKNDVKLNIHTINNSLVPVKYVMPIINIKENTEVKNNKKSICLTKILNIDTNLDYDFEKQIKEEKISEKISTINPNPKLNPIQILNPNPKYKYITLFFIFGILVFPIYKYLYIYK